MIAPGVSGVSLQVNAFEVQLILIGIFLAFALVWVTVVDPYLAERTGPERPTDSGGDPNS